MSYKQEMEMVETKFKEMDPTERLKQSIMEVLGVDNLKINREILTSGITPLEELRIKKEIWESERKIKGKRGFIKAPSLKN